MNKKNLTIRKISLLAMLLSLCMILPFITGRISQIGKIFALMHIPIFLCGFILGPVYGCVLGFIAPLINSFTFGMPILYPNAICMSMELFTYGLVSGLLFKVFKKRFNWNDITTIYISLISSMLLGRIIWGIMQTICGIISKNLFTWSLFLSGALLDAWPGIIIHLILIPSLILVLKKLNFLEGYQKNDSSNM